MNRKILSGCLLAAALAVCAGPVAAQDFSLGWNPRSGDVWVDTYLDDVNRYGSRYRAPFVDEMVRYYGAPRDLVNELLVDQRWAPGDVYYACAIAQIVGRPCRYVVERWQRDHGRGWGAVAQELGIEPGSPAFHRLKRGFVPTYDRWARPIAIDHDLQGDFPNRGKGPKGTYLDASRDEPGGKPAPGARGKGKPEHAGDAQRGGRGQANGKGKTGGSRNGNGNGED